MRISIDSLIIGLITFIVIIITIRASKMRIKDAIFWIVWTIMLSIFAFYPNTTEWIQTVFGVKDPDLYIIVLIVLFSYFVMFRNTITLSQHENKIKELSQIIAIQQLEQKKINKELSELIEKNK